MTKARCTFIKNELCGKPLRSNDTRCRSLSGNNASVRKQEVKSGENMFARLVQREKHVSCVCPFPCEKNERTTKVKEGIMIRRERERHLKKENHLMLAPFKESSEDLLHIYPLFFPTSSFSFPSTFIYLLFTFCSLTFPFFHFWVHFEIN